jgi:LysR family glycine cleavage system transcriptional activator
MQKDWRPLTTCFDRIAAEAELLQMRVATEITVACIPSIAIRWLIPALPEFLQRHPDLSVKVVYAIAEQRLRETGCDGLVTLGALGRNSLREALFHV